MFGLPILNKGWLIVIAFAVASITLGISHSMAYRAGKTAVLERLKDDRITILKDGRRIDDEVLKADDSELCSYLGGCQ